MSDLDATYGALFIGVLVSAVFFGVTMLQAFVYFQQYPSDRVWGKLAVCWLWFLDAFHLALSGHFVYYYLVLNYNNPSALLRVIWSFKLRAVVDALVVVSVHSLYTFRLWTLLAIDDHVEPFGEQARRWSSQKITLPACASRWMMRRIVPWFVSALVLVSYGIAIVMCYETFNVETFARLSHTPLATYVPLVCSTIIDAVIAGSLCYFLARCRTEFGAINGPLKTLMVYTLNTGIISSVCSLVAISMMVAYPNTFVTIAIEFLVIKLYINSYLAMLNARGGLATGHNRRSQLGYTPNASIRLREVGEMEQKHIPFPSFPHSCSSLHLTEQQVCTLPRRSGDDATSVDPAKVCHPDASLDDDLTETTGVVTATTPPRVPPSRFPPRADRLSCAPPPLPEPAVHAAAPRAPFPSNLALLKSKPACSGPLITPTTRTSPQVPSGPGCYPLSIAIPSVQDYPSPPERTLSPLRFGSPPTSFVVPGGTADCRPPEDMDMLPMVFTHAAPSGVPRDRYTRMVRNARSNGKMRRQLFDENGVALMWGLHEEKLASSAPAPPAPAQALQESERGGTPGVAVLGV